MKYINLFENFKVNEDYMRGGGPEKVLYIYGNAEEYVNGKKKMDSNTSYEYKKNEDSEHFNRVKELVKKTFKEKEVSFVQDLENSDGFDYFANTHHGGNLFLRFLNRGNAVRFSYGDYIEEGWITPSFYSLGEQKFRGPRNGADGGFIDEDELDLLIKTQNIADGQGLKKALREMGFNITDLAKRGIVLKKDQ